MLLTFGSMNSAIAADKRVINVFLLAGQSNMAGADSEVAVPPGFQQTVADRETRFTAAPLSDGERSPRYLPWGEIKGHEAKGKLVHGPEVGFARTLHSAGWRDVAIIKVYANFGRDAKSWPWGEGGELCGMDEVRRCEAGPKLRPKDEQLASAALSGIKGLTTQYTGNSPANTSAI